MSGITERAQKQGSAEAVLEGESDVWLLFFLIYILAQLLIEVNEIANFNFLFLML